jgi:hypothetical protein
MIASAQHMGNLPLRFPLDQLRTMYCQKGRALSQGCQISTPPNLKAAKSQRGQVGSASRAARPVIEQLDLLRCSDVSFGSRKGWHQENGESEIADQVGSCPVIWRIAPDPNE